MTGAKHLHSERTVDFQTKKIYIITITHSATVTKLRFCLWGSGVMSRGGRWEKSCPKDCPAEARHRQDLPPPALRERELSTREDPLPLHAGLGLGS